MGAWARASAVGWLLIGPAACAGAPPPAPAPPSSPSPLLGRPLPAFARETIAGGRLDTASLKGRVVVVKFFAEWCAPCARSMPALERFAKGHPEVAVIGLSIDEDPAQARAQVARYGLSFPVVHDPARVLGGRFRVDALPAAFVADRAGTLVWVGTPERTQDELDRAAEAAR
jgi:thiol-disulfide isomerase/thioredoxin